MALDEGVMTELLAALGAGGGLDVIREALVLVLQALIAAEAAQPSAPTATGAAPAGSPGATAAAPGCCRPRPAMSSCASPKLREGSFFPALVEPRRRIDRALPAVVMEASAHGTSTGKVNDLVRALGVEAGISRS
jgi:putative transposase